MWHVTWGSWESVYIPIQTPCAKDEDRMALVTDMIHVNQPDIIQTVKEIIAEHNVEIAYMYTPHVDVSSQ